MSETAIHPLLDMIEITKEFRGVKAIDRVSFRLKAGTVHALIGENGAGKSTLMNILAGVHIPEAGRIIIKGTEKSFSAPRDAIDNGIAMIHQELSVAQEMTVAENIFMGREFRKGAVVDRRKMASETQKLLDRVGLTVSPNRKMKELTVAQAQMVEIAKAISRQAKIIIMDEPTSSITSREVNTLFEVICGLKAEGCGIIYITHKMDEIFKIADEVTVMRDGHYIGTYLPENITDRELIRLMIDRELNEVYKKRQYTSQEVYFSAKGLTSQRLKFSDISFDVHKGEILGLAGLVGAGRTETVESIFGLNKLDSGEIYLNGKQIHIRSPKEAIRHGIGLVTEDRKLSGIIPLMNCSNNMTLVHLKVLSKFGWLIQRKNERSATEEFIKALRIKISNGPRQLISELSGGNQQKCILAKWIMASPDLLILDEPTRGIDVGAKVEIYHLVTQLAEAGKTIIVISSEMPEIIGLCDRILVFHEGHINGELQKEKASQETILSMAVNVS